MGRDRNDYIYIREWHRDSGSYPYYINDMVAKARADRAPATAVYQRHETGEWVCLEDLGQAARERLEMLVHQRGQQ